MNKQPFSITRGLRIVSSTIPPCPNRSVVCHAVDAYAFLLPKVNQAYGARAFADLVRSYSSHPRAQAIADAVESADAGFPEQENRHAC